MTSPLRIAYVIGQLTHGGTECQLYELVRNLDRDSFNPLVCSLSSGGYWADHIRAQGIDVVELHRRGHYDVLRFWKLYRLLLRWKPDIVQTMLWSANSYGRIASRLAGVPRVIACERAVDPSKGALKVSLDRLLDRFTDPGQRTQDPFRHPASCLEVMWKGKAEGEQIFIQEGHPHLKTLPHTGHIDFEQVTIRQSQTHIGFGSMDRQPLQSGGPPGQTISPLAFE